MAYFTKRKGKMDYQWAMDHPEHVKTYYKRNGKCQNPHNGHYPIHVRHVLRNKYSGESVEIGTQCFWRWQAAHGIIVPELSEYEERLMARQIEEWAKEGPMTGDEFKRRRIKAALQRSRKLYIRMVQQKNPVRIDIPISDFLTEKEAEEYAEKHGGYCQGSIHLREFEYWCLYIPRENTQKTYVCLNCHLSHSSQHYQRSLFCRKCGSFLKAKYTVRERSGS